MQKLEFPKGSKLCYQVSGIPSISHRGFCGWLLKVFGLVWDWWREQQTSPPPALPKFPNRLRSFHQIRGWWSDPGLKTAPLLHVWFEQVYRNKDGWGTKQTLPTLQEVFIVFPVHWFPRSGRDVCFVQCCGQTNCKMCDTQDQDQLQHVCGWASFCNRWTGRFPYLLGYEDMETNKWLSGNLSN